MFNQFGDLERCALRPGNVHSADGWEGVLKPVIVRYQGKVLRIYFRADAAFAMPGVYEWLEAERVKYAIRLPANQVLQNRIAYLLKRPVGRPPNEVRRYYANFTYKAASWTKPRRVVAKVEWHPGELIPRVGFIATNMNLLEHLPWDGDLGHLEGDVAAVADDLGADLDQLLLQARQRPVLDRLGRRQRAHVLQQARHMRAMD